MLSGPKAPLYHIYHSSVLTNANEIPAWLIWSKVGLRFSWIAYMILLTYQQYRIQSQGLPFAVIPLEMHGLGVAIIVRCICRPLLGHILVLLKGPSFSCAYWFLMASSINSAGSGLPQTFSLRNIVYCSCNTSVTSKSESCTSKKWERRPIFRCKLCWR